MKLSFHGATEEVTGSCYLLETERAKILIDCGMKQGERVCMARSLDDFGFDPASLDAVLITHAHFDHTGRLPELVKKGFRGPIFLTPPTKSLTEIILDDSIGIMTENAERCGDPVAYEPKDKELAIAQMQGVGYRTEFAPAPGILATFHDAGHILGSSFIAIDITSEENPSGKPYRIVFSGDVGNDDVPILPDTEPLERADVVVCESTYGDRDHDPATMRSAELYAFAKKIFDRHGTLIIPAFSIERTQELLYELDKLLTEGKLPQVPIYLDSPLAIRATEIYRHFVQYIDLEHEIMKGNDLFTFPSLHETLYKEDSIAINDDHRPKIIIAGNGMMTGGRVLHHLRRYLPDKKSGVLIVGYQAYGTLGRRIYEGAKNVKIFGTEIEVEAEIGKIEAFSAHGDREKIARWLHPQTGPVPRVFLIHGETETKEKFADYLEKTLNATVTIPRLYEVFNLPKA